MIIVFTHIDVLLSSDRLQDYPRYGSSKEAKGPSKKGRGMEKGNTGRMSTWTVPVAMMIIEGGVEYAIKYCKGEITEKCDSDALLAELQKIGGDEVKFSNYVDTDAGELTNFKMIIAPFFDF